MSDAGKDYESVYREFDSPVMRQLRREAYGEDIGQHSWVTADELRADISRLGLSGSSRLLDLGCGPCGPLVFVVQNSGCHAIGTEISAAALAAGRARVAAAGVEHLIGLRQLDLNDALPLPERSFDVAVSYDVVLHLRDRTQLFSQLARLLVPGGKLLFTDAAVLTGSISSEQTELRSAHGFTQFAAVGFNERALGEAGFALLETEDRTAHVLKNATGRLAARLAHRAELERVEGAESFERQQRYLDTVITLARSAALSRVMYLATNRNLTAR